MSRFRSCLAVLVVSAVAATLPSRVIAQGTVAADAFVEAAGINIHLHYDEAIYKKQFPLIKERLIELGIRHVRDGLEDTAWQGYYDRHNELGDAGMKGTFIVRPDQATEVWASYPARVSRSFEAYEAPNEYDRSRDPYWPQVLNETLRRLRTLRDIPGLEQYPVYGPSLTTAQAYGWLGNVSDSYDFSNLHTYFAGRHPGTPGWGTGGYGSIEWNLGYVRKYSGGKPTITTETGYQDIESAHDPVPQEVAGRYAPRLLLEHFRAGVVRTFLYELADFPRSGGYGLLNADGSPKPAFTAVKNLLNLLADPGPAFTPQDLGYTVSLQGTREVRHMAFQKRDGTYYLVLWLAEPSWDPIVRTMVQPQDSPVNVGFASLMQVVRLHTWQRDGSVVAEDRQVTTAILPVTVTDALTIVEVVRPEQQP